MLSERRDLAAAERFFRPGLFLIGTTPIARSNSPPPFTTARPPTPRSNCRCRLTIPCAPAGHPGCH